MFFLCVLTTYWSRWIVGFASSTFPASGISWDSNFFNIISHLLHSTLNVSLPGIMSPSQCCWRFEPLTDARQYTLVVTSGMSGMCSLSRLWSIARPISATEIVRFVLLVIYPHHLCAGHRLRLDFSWRQQIRLAHLRVLLRVGFHLVVQLLGEAPHFAALSVGYIQQNLCLARQ